jgi:histidine triad (HIT) family protein
MSDTIFGKIISGEIPSEFLYEDEHCIAINDINPQSPVHVLVIPRKPIRMLVDAEPEDQALLGHLMLVAGKVARDLGVEEGFRVVVNNGESVGMTIYHLHLHIMGGRTFAEGKMAG